MLHAATWAVLVLARVRRGARAWETQGQGGHGKCEREKEMRVEAREAVAAAFRCASVGHASWLLQGGCELAVATDVHPGPVRPRYVRTLLRKSFACALISAVEGKTPCWSAWRKCRRALASSRRHGQVGCLTSDKHNDEQVQSREQGCSDHCELVCLIFSSAELTSCRCCCRARPVASVARRLW